MAGGVSDVIVAGLVPAVIVAGLMNDVRHSNMISAVLVAPGLVSACLTS